MKKMDSFEKKLSVFFSGLAGVVLVLTCVLLLVDNTRSLAKSSEAEVLGITYYNRKQTIKETVQAPKKGSEAELEIDNSDENKVLLDKENDTEIVDNNLSKDMIKEPADTFVDNKNNEAQVDDGAAAFVNSDVTLTDSELNDLQDLENAGVDVEY